MYVPLFQNELKAYQFLDIMNPSNNPGVCHYRCAEYLIFSIVLPSVVIFYICLSMMTVCSKKGNDFMFMVPCIIIYSMK